MVKRGAWLSITPEPERELPAAVAVLRAGGPAGMDSEALERARVEQIVLSGSQRRWLAYLHEVVGLIEAHARGADGDSALARARRHAIAVIANHHNLLLALPGPGARRTAADRAALTRVASPAPYPDDTRELRGAR